MQRFFQLICRAHRHHQPNLQLPFWAKSMPAACFCRVVSQPVWNATLAFGLIGANPYSFFHTQQLALNFAAANQVGPLPVEMCKHSTRQKRLSPTFVVRRSRQPTLTPRNPESPSGSADVNKQPSYVSWSQRESGDGRSEMFRVSDVLVRRYYISAGVPQPSASSSNLDLHFKASKHQLLLNHNIFSCAFAVYCLYKYVKAVFKLSGDSISINLDGNYANFGSGWHKFSPPSPLQTRKSLSRNVFSFFSQQTKELKAM